MTSLVGNTLGEVEDDRLLPLQSSEATPCQKIR